MVEMITFKAFHYSYYYMAAMLLSVIIWHEAIKMSGCWVPHQDNDKNIKLYNSYADDAFYNY